MAILETVKEKTDSAINSAGQFSKIAIDTLEKSSRASVDSCNFYSQLGIKQLRALAAIKDQDSLRNFISGTVSAVGEMTKHAVEDCQNGIALGKEMRTAVSGLFSSSNGAGESPDKSTAESPSKANSTSSAKPAAPKSTTG